MTCNHHVTRVTLPSGGNKLAASGLKFAEGVQVNPTLPVTPAFAAFAAKFCATLLKLVCGTQPERRERNTSLQRLLEKQ